MQHLKFRKNESGSLFYEELKKEVNGYFTVNNITHYSNSEMITKCIFWIALWFASWTAIIYFKDQFYLAVGIGILHMFTHLMIAFNIAHDANHMALFSSKKMNNFFGYFMEVLGCNKKLWIITHNQEHHTFINIHEYDNNIDGYKLLRLSPGDKWFSYHRFQWLYATLIYGLSTLNYATFRDIKMIIRYVKSDKLKVSKAFIFEFLFFKVIYYSYLFAIPILVFNASFKLVLAYFLLGHFVNGIFLVYVFLTGHLTETTSYPEVNEQTIDNNWAVHVVQTTGDYAPKSKIFSWFIGSLNLHVAHHLFPTICHVHYKNISPIIKRVVEKHGYVYREIPSFWSALYSHFTLLKALGKPEMKDSTVLERA